MSAARIRQRSWSRTLIVNGASASEAIAFYKRTRGTHELYRTVGPSSAQILFAELLLRDSRIFVVDGFPEQEAFSPLTLGSSSVALHLYGPSLDAAFAQAVAAGMTPQIPVADLLWASATAR